ncbi:MAG: DUF255 domain-containing protein [Candidatus Sumerlaeaceae bacterium]|jgi:hypothetical protein
MVSALRQGYATPVVGGMMIALLAVAAVSQGQPGSSPSAQAGFVVPISQIDRNYLRSEVTIQGTITAYKASWRETAPHSFILSDGTGNLRIAIWPGVWNKIPFNDKLREGQEITARVAIAEFRGALEGHLDKFDQIWLGLAKPELAKSSVQELSAATTTGAAEGIMQAPPIEWKNSIRDALETAKKSNKEILVLFANPDSDNGRFVEEKIFGDSRVRAALAKKFIAVKIDMRTDADLARQLQAFRAGTVGFYRANGQPKRAHLVPRTVDELLDAVK